MTESLNTATESQSKILNVLLVAAGVALGASAWVVTSKYHSEVAPAQTSVAIGSPSSAEAAIAQSGAAGASVDSSSAPHQIKVLQQGTAHDALFGLSFDGDQGLAVGAGGAIFESADAGATWKPVAQKATELALLAVARRGKYSLAVGQLGTILTEQAPQQWVAVDSGVKNRLLSVSVNSAGIALASGEFGAVLKSADGGHSWTPVTPNWGSFIVADANSTGTDQPNVYSALVSDDGVFTVAGEFGLIVRSKDGGQSWQIVHPGAAAAASVFAVYLADTAGAASFAVGQSGLILKSFDGGNTWSPVASTGTGANLLGVAISGQHVVITGMRAMLLSNDGGMTWSNLAEGDTLTSWYQAARTVGSGGLILAVGNSGKIIQIGK